MNKRRLFLKKIDNALISILCNYAAISFSIAAYEHKLGGFAAGIASIICIFWITSLPKE